MNAFKRRAVCFRVDFAALLGLFLFALFTVAPVDLAAQTSMQQAAAELSRGNYPQAVEASRAALLREPHSLSARLLYARALDANGDARNALDQIQRGLAAAPDDPDLLYYAVKISSELGRGELEQLHNQAPDSARNHQLLAEIAAAEKDTPQAVAEYQAALDRDPQNYELIVALADFERRSALLCEQAIPLYERAIAIHPEDTDSFFGIGMCQIASGNPAKAVEAFRQVVTRQPKYAAAQYQLGEALVQVGDPRQALPCIQAAVRLEPNFKQAYFLLGRVYSLLGQKDLRSAALKKFQELQLAEEEQAQENARERGRLQQERGKVVPQ